MLTKVLHRSMQPSRSTRSLSLVTVAHPATSSSLLVTDRYIWFASLWNQLLESFSQAPASLSVYCSTIPYSLLNFQ